MLIPYQELDTDTLDNLIESFIFREGTDYGEYEISLSEKKSAILQQLQQGNIVIIYSEHTETVTLIAHSEFIKQQHK